MATNTSIEWTDATWNPVAGCSIVSAGCTNCYAMRMAARLQAMGSAKYRGLTRKSGKRHIWTGKIRCDATSLEAPLKWRRPMRIFVNSMSDLFHEAVPSTFVSEVWRVMERTPRHTYQILTKRPERMAALTRGTLNLLPNVWLGVSVESREVVDRIASLRAARAAIKFISFEPLIGSVKSAKLDGIDWAIVGGESGPRARPMEASWVDEIEENCRRTGTLFFFKQWGGHRKDRTGRTRNNRTYDDMPARDAAEGNTSLSSL